MTQTLKAVALSGSTFLPSRSLVLAQSLLDGFGRHLHIDSQLIHLGDIARVSGAAQSRRELAPEAEAVLQAIESAALLIVVSPVYRGALPGQLKHLLDLVGQDALVDTPVLLAACGGSDRHALVIDHQLRPLFSFFQSVTLPIGVYATDADFSDYRICSPSLQARIDLAVARALPFFRAHQREPQAAQARIAA
ncbi:FMN reductase [Orrella sp. JC864]|uniref:FMN reductase n=1 Tax=Orrella sp. JC864 TaxID=3120298 RepID=UPI0012BCD95A